LIGKCSAGNTQLTVNKSEMLFSGFQTHGRFTTKKYLVFPILNTFHNFHKKIFKLKNQQQK